MGFWTLLSLWAWLQGRCNLHMWLIGMNKLLIRQKNHLLLWITLNFYNVKCETQKIKSTCIDHRAQETVYDYPNHWEPNWAPSSAASLPPSKWTIIHNKFYGYLFLIFFSALLNIYVSPKYINYLWFGAFKWFHTIWWNRVTWFYSTKEFLYVREPYVLKCITQILFVFTAVSSSFSSLLSQLFKKFLIEEIA